jgi:hypothetical protein
MSWKLSGSQQKAVSPQKCNAEKPCDGFSWLAQLLYFMIKKLFLSFFLKKNYIMP